MISLLVRGLFPPEVAKDPAISHHYPSAIPTFWKLKLPEVQNGSYALPEVQTGIVDASVHPGD
jgi:hypothetical protein